MYCKQCGKELTPNAAVCLSCGVKVGDGASYCANCGEAVLPNAAVCTKCGAELNNVTPGTARKSKLVAGLLGIFLGGWGVHNFYLGYTGKGIAQILLSFCFGIGAIWGFIEGILILCDKITTDAHGVPLENNANQEDAKKFRPQRGRKKPSFFTPSFMFARLCQFVK